MNNRVYFLIIFAILLCTALLGFIFHMQHNAYNKYSNMALKNRIIKKPIKASRGLILDRNNLVIAENRPSINVYLNPKTCDSIPKALDFIDSFSPISDYARKKLEQRIKQQRGFDIVAVKQDITDEQATLLYSHIPSMPCVSVHEDTQRQYNKTPAISTVIGYQGANGIETTFNELLSGVDGTYYYEVNSARMPIRLIDKVDPIKGYDLKLTIDAKLQEFAYNAFAEENGAAVAINIENGEILTMVSHPSFDSNLFLKAISHEDYKKLLNDPNLPLLDRVAKGRFAPGSTIKPFMAMAALQAGYISKDFAINDNLGYFIPKGTKHVYRDWLRTGGHGRVDIKTSLAYSCDVFFYKLSMLVGMKRILPWLEAFGFGQNLVAEVPYANQGILSSPSWKKQYIKQPWYTGDTVMSYIGQGFMLTTPLQLASSLSILANAGKIKTPHLLKAVLTDQLQIQKSTATQNRLKLDPENLALVKSGMEAVIRDKSPWATGWRFGKPSYSVAGKTGTSQVVHDSRKTQQKDWKKSLRDNSWFMAFAPVKHPKVVLVVITEHSSSASKVARKILDFIEKQHIYF